MSEAEQQTHQLSSDALERIERECEKYPKSQRQSAIMAALRIAQAEHGWLPKDLIARVAEAVGVPAIRAYEIATFYNMYDLKPVGEHKICVCTNVPCALMGSATMAQRLKEKLGIDFGETTQDGKYTLAEGECFGACVDAPVVIVNNTRMHTKITPDKLDEFLAGLD